MKFKYYITDLFNGVIVGTNNEQQAKELAECEEYFILEVESGGWITSSTTQCEIKELKYDTE